MERYDEYMLTADAILTETGFAAGRALIIKDGYIDRIDSALTGDAGIKVLDFAGCTITPCFCDYHLHFFSRDSAEADSIAGDLISHGIKSVVDGGSKDLYSFKMKESVGHKLDIKTAGSALYKKGTYGGYIGRGVDTVLEAQAIIDELAEYGADYIKIINSGVYEPDTGEISEGGFTCHELNGIVQYAQSKGLDTACHANGERAVQEAVQSGVSMIIHGMSVTDETLSLMAEKGTAFIPTGNAFESLKKISTGRDALKHIEKTVSSQLSAISRAFARGVKVLPGSDAGPAFIPYGTSFHEEMRFFQKAGISVKDILLSAVKGTLQQGGQADFLVLRGLEIEKVFIGGKEYTETEFNQSLY
jgi:imidazolonepropionase-like amidohydrolase